MRLSAKLRAAERAELSARILEVEDQDRHGRATEWALRRVVAAARRVMVHYALGGLPPKKRARAGRLEAQIELTPAAHAPCGRCDRPDGLQRHQADGYDRPVCSRCVDELDLIKRRAALRSQ